MPMLVRSTDLAGTLIPGPNSCVQCTLDKPRSTEADAVVL